MRFLVTFYLWLVLIASSGLFFLFEATGYASLIQRVWQPNYGLSPGERQLALTPGRLVVLCWGMGGVAVLALCLLGLLKVWGPRTGRGIRWWLLEGWRCWAALLRPWFQLSPTQRGVAISLMGATAVVRLWYAFAYPLILDELASYDYCVLPGPAVTTSYYPFPNNHILANLLASGVHGLWPGASAELALRLLPTVTGILFLPVVYLLLLRYLPATVVTFGLGLFWLSPLPLFYAIAGRGYAWAMLAALAGLGATCELLRPQDLRTATRRWAWVVFGLSACLGLYAVPTHLYTVLGLGLGLLIGIGRLQGRPRDLGLAQLAISSGGIGIVMLICYAPVGAVSGWSALLANRYIARSAWLVYKAAIGPFLVTTAADFMGHRGWSVLVFSSMVVSVPPVLVLARGLPQATRRIAWLLYGQLTLWLLVAIAQRVYPPTRTLLLVLFAFFMLAALIGHLAVRYYWPTLRWQRAVAVSVGLLGGGYGSYRLVRERGVLSFLLTQQATLRPAYVWLRTHPVRRIWVASREYALIWHHYDLADGLPPLPLLVKEDASSRRAQSTGEVEVLASLPSPPPPVLYQGEHLFIVPALPVNSPLVKP
jgi:hypothetical protein